MRSGLLVRQNKLFEDVSFSSGKGEWVFSEILLTKRSINWSKEKTSWSLMCNSCLSIKERRWILSDLGWRMDLKRCCCEHVMNLKLFKPRGIINTNSPSGNHTPNTDSVSSALLVSVSMLKKKALYQILYYKHILHQVRR